MIDANRDRFIMHQNIPAPRSDTKRRLSRKSTDRVVYIEEAASNDARKLRGTIEGSVNVESLQHHHELGCSVTNDGGATPFYLFHL